MHKPPSCFKPVSYPTLYTSIHPPPLPILDLKQLKLKLKNYVPPTILNEEYLYIEKEKLHPGSSRGTMQGILPLKCHINKHAQTQS